MNLEHYQSAAARNAEGLTADRLTMNLMIAMGEMAKTQLAAEDVTTRPFNDAAMMIFRQSYSEAAKVQLAAIIFNAAALADRFGIALEPLLEKQVEKMGAITDSGKLRMRGGDNVFILT
jgi:hypothetical protein